MEKMLEMLSVLAPILVALGLGIVSRKTRLVSREGVNGLKGLVTNFALPATLFGVFYTADYDKTMLIVILVMVACCAAAFGMGFLARRAIPGVQPLLPYQTTVFEAGMLGYGMYTILYSADELYHFAKMDLGQAFFFFTIYFTMLNGRGGRMDLRQSVRNTLRSPIVMALALGAVLGITGLGPALAASAAGPIVGGALSYIAAPTGMLMIFVVGYGLEWRKAAFKPALVALASRAVITALCCAGFLLLAGLFMPINEYQFWAAILFFSLPGTFLLPMYAHSEEEEAYAATTLSLGSILTILVFTAILFLR